MADYYIAMDRGQQHHQATISSSATPSKKIELRVDTGLDRMAVKLALDNLMRRVLESNWPPL